MNKADNHIRRQIIFRRRANIIEYIALCITNQMNILRRKANTIGRIISTKTGEMLVRKKRGADFLRPGSGGQNVYLIWQPLLLHNQRI